MDFAIGIIFIVAIACIAAMVKLGRPARATETTAELRRRFPDSPWKWDPKWEGGVVRGALKTNMYFHWLFAVLWTLLSAPLAYMLPEEVFVKKNYPAAVGFLFPLVSVFLFGNVIRLTMQWVKYGSSELQLTTFPGSVGGRFAARLDTTLRTIPEDGVHLRLNSYRVITRSNESDRQDLLWQGHRVVPPLSLGQGAKGVTIPIEFYLPAGIEPTTPPQDRGEKNRREPVVWKLDVNADVPGIDYSAQFEVPIFVTGDVDESPPKPRFAREQTTVFDPSKATVEISSTATGGSRFVFPMARNPGAALGITVFTALWWGVIAFMHYIGFNIFFLGLFGLFGLLLAWFSLDLWFGTSVATIEGGQLRVRSAIFGIGSTRVYSTTEIDDIEVSVGMKQQETMTQRAKAWYDLKLKPKIGRPKMIGGNIKDKHEAEWLADRMRTALGIS
jgi:hypothetical protein